MKIHGPAIIEEPTTTVVVPPHWELSVNRFGDYELSLI
jgi:N-methylhydantoinase A/oxoprolinase/acetone carboxylase beta subunit